MNYEHEPRVVIYTRDTAGYRAISWQARGLSLELTRKLDAAGEVSLGRRGLEAVAALIGGPWSEIEPFLQELLEDGRLVHDAERRVLRDPQHAARQAAARAPVGIVPNPAHAVARRAPSESPAAVRARRARAAKKAALVAASDRQLTIPVCAHERDDRDARALCDSERHASRDVTPPSAGSLEDLAAKWDLPPCDASRDVTPSSLSDLFSDHEVKTERARTPNVTLDPSALPDDFARVARDRRPDLGEGDVAASWAVFAGMHTGKWRSLGVLLGKWRGWVARERGSSTTPVHAPPRESGPRLARAELAAGSRIVAERERWEAAYRKAEGSRDEVVAMLSRVAAGELVAARAVAEKIAKAS